MTEARSGRRLRQRGEVEELPSGALRVKVYAGEDPLTGRRHYLRETIAAGPTAAREAEHVRARLLNQVDEGRNPRTKATVNQLMDRYLELLNVDVTTRAGYEGYIRNHIRPLLGRLQVGRLNGETLDSFYTVLRTCRTHCGGKKYIEHRTPGEHECDQRCKPHECRPLATSSIRQIHFCLRGALKRAVRWRWIATNPLDQAEPPGAATADPHPPTPEQAAAIVNEAFRDLSWGLLVWMAMTTGARRGELCAMRWDLLDLDNQVLSIRTSIGQQAATTWEKDTKTHQQRRIALDANTVALMKAYRDHCESLVQEFGRTLAGRDVFSRPRSTTRRRGRDHAARLLGMGGQADQRAAGHLGGRMPSPPLFNDVIGTPKATVEPKAADNPYQRIAADLRGAIVCGALRPGDQLPTVADLANRYSVSVGTAQRAVAELRSAELVTVSRGRRAVVSATHTG